MKPKAHKIASSLDYYAQKYGWPETSRHYNNGERTNFSLDLRIEDNLSKDVMIDTFLIQTKQVGPNIFELKSIYNETNVVVKNHRKNGIDCLVGDGKYANLFRTPNESGRYGFTEVNIDYKRPQKHSTTQE